MMSTAGNHTQEHMHLCNKRSRIILQRITSRIGDRRVEIGVDIVRSSCELIGEISNVCLRIPKCGLRNVQNTTKMQISTTIFLGQPAVY